jgi:choline dehydrogenase-like flavoprotein
MTLTENNCTNDLQDKWPTLIVGAGTVGLFLAHELMKKGEKIVLIEAGGDTIQSFHSNEYKSIGHSLDGVSIGRTKGIGGTSNLWGGQLTEFIENDIDEKGALGQPLWPISWNEVNRYYLETYNKLGFSNSWKNNKEKLSSSEQEKYLELFYTRWIKQPNFKYHFLHELMNSNLVTIILNATVTNMFFTDRECYSIEIIKNGRKERIDEFKRLVLANGTIEICRLLLISLKSKNCPFMSNRWIGKYFQDHINLRVGQIIKPSRSFFERFSNIVRDGEKLQPKIRIRSNKEDNNYLGISGIFTFDSNVAHHIDNIKQFGKAILGQSKEKHRLIDLVKMFIKMTRAIPQIILIIYNYIKHNRIYIPYNSKVTLAIQAQQISIPESSISLSDDEYDDFGRPKVLVNWQIDGNEFNNIRDFCNKIREYLNENGFGNLQFTKWFEDECINHRGIWIKQIFDSYHQAGGAIMSNSNDYGVVDWNLKVHDTNNVFVCGACVLPTSSSGNTGLTALALTLRLAGYLTKKQEVKQ